MHVHLVRYDSFPSNSMLPHIFNPKSTTLLLILLVKKATYGQNHRLVPCSSMIQKPIWRYLNHIKSIQISLFNNFSCVFITSPRHVPQARPQKPLGGSPGRPPGKPGRRPPPVGERNEGMIHPNNYMIEDLGHSWGTLLKSCLGAVFLGGV